ncbi:hypothetical protein G9A89_010741 [Geosiphon pyriformis]|nr:hypothetical protein G9A89_010741 [Geosiphon pyriformis]
MFAHPLPWKADKEAAATQQGPLAGVDLSPYPNIDPSLLNGIVNEYTEPPKPGSATNSKPNDQNFIGSLLNDLQNPNQRPKQQQKQKQQQQQQQQQQPSAEKPVIKPLKHEKPKSEPQRALTSESQPTGVGTSKQQQTPTNNGQTPTKSEGGDLPNNNQSVVINKDETNSTLENPVAQSTNQTQSVNTNPEQSNENVPTQPVADGSLAGNIPPTQTGNYKVSPSDSQTQTQTQTRADASASLPVNNTIKSPK